MVDVPNAAHIEEIAERAATKAVHSILITLGVDVENPLEAQRDFHTLRDLTKLAADPEFQKDLAHIRAWRKRSEAISAKGALAFLTALITGAATALWVGLQHLITSVRIPH